MAQNINQNGNFHTPLSPMRFQSSMGKEVRRKYKDGKNMVRLSLARVVKVNYKYNTVDVISIQDKNDTTKNPNDNGRYSARLPVQFGGQTPDGKVFGSNTLVTEGALVLVGFLEGHKDNPIIINVYGDADNQSMLTRTSYTGADASDEDLQAELWQLFTLYPSMTYKNIDGHGNQEVTFPGKTFFYASADDDRVNDSFFDYDHLPSSSYANGDLIEPTSPNAPNMLYVHQGLVDDHRVTFFVKSDGTVRVGSRHDDGKGVTFWQMNTDGSFKIQQTNDSVDPEDVSSNFSSFSIEENGDILLQAGSNVLAIGKNGLLLNGGAVSGGNLDLSTNQTIIDMQGDITNIQKTTTTDGIIQTVTNSTPWHNINQTVDNKATTFIATPAPPYNIGDIWENNGQVYICQVPKGFGATFSVADWVLSADVTSQNTANDTANVNGQTASTVTGNITSASTAASNAQTTAEAKSEMFLSQPTPPYNKGDGWNDNGVLYVANITRPDGASFLQADWTRAADVTGQNTANDTTNVNGQSSSNLTSTVSSNTSAASTAQSTANSKAKTFTSTPTVPYSLGDMWNQSGKVYSCINPKASNGSFNSLDWVLVADITSSNTAADTSAVNGVASATVNSNITSASTAASNAQSTANSAQSTANSANSLATSKAKAFITQPVPPYSVGDVWDNSSTVYICQTARSTGSFVLADWKLAGDVTSSNTSADTTAVNGVASATVNSNITSASTAASNANSLAQSKAKGFVTQPVPPYSQGDVWDNSGTVYICSTARSTGSFTQSDWTLSGDVTANNTAHDTTNVNGQTSSTLTGTVSSNTTAASNAQTTANSKAKTFTSTPVVPYNLGDIYKNGQTVYVCTTAKTSVGSYSSSDWTLVGDVTSQNTSADTTAVNGVASATVNSNISSASTSASNAQTTANSKAKTFTATPTIPYSLGDIYRNGSAIYVCTTARSTGAYTASDFTLVGDVTANNTSADTSKVNGVASSTVNSNITSASTAASNAQTSANNAQSTANSAQSLATSKAQGFLTQPVPPYNQGDVWDNNGTVYICNTAKASGTIFSAADWTLSGDVTGNNTAKDTAAVNGVASSTVNSNITSASTAASNAQTTANSKAEGFITQPIPPYSAGDVWNNSGTVYVCTTARSTGSFTQSDWTLAGDVTSSNTSSDTSHVNGQVASTLTGTVSSNTTAASNAQSTANSANTAASNAQTTANSKAQGFVAQPVPPYNKGDVWNNSGTVYICTTAKASGTTYALADWTLSGDVTASNTSADTSKVNGVASATVNSNITSASTAASNAQTTANSKAKTFTAQPTIPYSVGDIYQSGQTVYICTIARSSGAYTASDWKLSGDVTSLNTAADTSAVNGVASSTVNSNITSASTAASNAQTTANSANTAASNAQTTANSKAEGFVSQPVPPYNLGDVWNNSGTVYICTTAKASGTTFAQADWTLAGDVTASNTAHDTANVNGQVASTLTGTISSNTTAASNAQSTANSANTAASNAQTTANSKAQGFVAQPVPPYNKGDVWNNSGTVYVCTTAKASGTTYALSDWTLVGDVTANNTSSDTAHVNGVVSSTVNSNISSASTAASNAQTTANSKAKTFTAQPTIPYSVGDIYKNGSTVYVCTTARSSGSYTASDFILVGDVTANNTSSDTSHVNGQVASTLTGTVSSNTTAASNAQTSANNAQSSANTAQSTANSKAQGFVAQPAPPYNTGDVWNNNGTVYVCTTTKASGTVYALADWTLVGDVTSNNTAKDTAAVNGVVSSTVNSNISSAQTAASNAQTTANSKAKTFTATPTIPYSVGDIYKNGSTVYVCTLARSSGSYTASDFTLVGDVTANNTSADTSKVNGVASSTVNSNITSASTAASNAQTSANNAQSSANTAQSTANSKAQGFIAQPVPPYNTGDVWNNSGTVYVCTTAKASSGTYALADWTLVGDVTANNTSADTANVNGTVASTVISNISTAQSTASSASSAASSAQTSANTAQTTANSKAQTFTATPVPPYSVGDIYKNGSAVYVCTTAKASGGTYVSTDFILVGDVTANNTSADTTAVNGVASATVNSNISSASTAASNAQTTANSKAKTFTVTPTIPYSVGDIYKNGSTVYVCTTARSSGSYTASDFILVGDVTANNTSSDTSHVNGVVSSTVNSNISTAQSTANTAQSTANSKAQTFTATPVPPYSVGDIYKNGSAVYVCTTAKASGATYSASDFILVGDVTANNTASDTSHVNGQVASTLTSTVSSNTTSASNAQTTANSANTAASNAQTTANSKAQGFVSQPVPPYNTGDVWNNSGTVYVCTTSKASSGTYALADWTLVGDVTSNNTAKDTAAVNGVVSSTVNSNISTAQSTANTAQTTANSKAQTFTATPAPPYSIGDIYKNGSAVYVCTTAKASGGVYAAGDFTLVGDVTANNTSSDTAHVNGVVSSTVNSNISSASTSASNAQTTANSKAKGFISQPTIPYSAGDVWNNSGTIYVCTLARSSGSYTATDWTLVGDVTGNNTAKDTAAVNGVVSATVNSNITSASTAASNAQTSANNAQSSANTAQSTANSKAQTFTSTPVPPYSVGDIFKNGSTVYVCTTAKASGGTYVSTDFILVGDVTSQNTSADTTNVNGVASTTVNSNISSASSAASNAQTTANSKAQTFTTTPAPPYSVGDIYKNGSAVYVCTTAKASGGTYASTDFVLVGDVTANNTASDTSHVNGQVASTLTGTVSSNTTAASNAQTTANSKAKTFTATPTIPYSLGDIYKNGATIYVCTLARSSGSYTASDFTLVGDITANNTAADTSHVNGQVASTLTSTVSSNTTSASNAQTSANNAQTTANSKAQTFTATPVPPYSIGDIYKNGSAVYVCTTAKASGGTYVSTDFILVGDVTANNTSADTTAVNGVASATVNSNITSANTAASNAQSTANSASSSASAAQTTANSKAQTFTATPAPPYNVGDIYKNGSTVYVCTTAKASGTLYSAADFTLVGDVTANNTSSDTSHVNGQVSSTLTGTVSSNTTAASNAQTTANSKAKTFTATPTIPYSLGDIYKNGSAVYVCTVARSSGSYTASDFTLVGDVTANNTASDTSHVNGVVSSTVNSNISTAQSTANTAQTSANTAQTTANSKAQTFTATPVPPYSIGDIFKNGQTVYVCTTAKASGGTYVASDFTLVGDITSQNTAADTTAVNGVASATVNSNITSANTAASNAQSTANSANTAASNAQTTANSKAQTFTATPAPPYSVGDIYKNGSAVYVCTTAKASGGLYSAGDFTLVGDVTANNTAADTTAVNGVASATVNSNISSASTAASNAQTTANTKAKTWTSQPVPPYSLGDIYQTTYAVYICTLARSTGAYTASDWYLAGDVTTQNTAKDTSAVNGVASATVNSNISSASTAASNAQTTANSKAKTFTATPTIPYSLGDIYKNGSAVYVCTLARSSGSYTASDFALVGDVTANNTSADTSKVNGVASATVNSNITSASTAASNAQTTANSKAKTYTVQPTVPYSLGDIWQNSGKVYICTTAETSAGAFNQADWYLAGDVTSQNTAADTSAVNGVASSTVNSNISSASTAASNAQTTANSKAQTFTTTPVPPYNVGDIYKNGATVSVCTTAKASGGTYAAGDFVLASDVTANNTSADTTAVNGVASATVNSNISSASTAASNAQSTANSKAKTWTTQPVPPYSLGDIYQSTYAVYICTLARSTGTYTSSDWYLAGDVTTQNTAKDTSAVNGVASATVNSNISSASTAASNAQTTANSKAKTYTVQPAPPYNTGDVWQSTNAVYICTAGRASGSYTASDWYKAGDVTSANTSADTTAVNGVASSTVNSNISSASTAASNAQTTANSKAKTWTAQPVPPYSTGDVWQTTNAVYICTAGRASGTYTATDWYKAGDVTSANTAADTTAVNGVASSTVNSNITSASTAASNAQTTANSKAKVYTVQPTPPYNVGDIWQNSGSVYVCTAGRASGSYTSTDWYKAGDVTANNTAADVTSVNGVAASTVTSNASNGNSAYGQIQTQVGVGGTIETTAGSQTKVNNLVIGARNYLRNTSNFDAAMTNWSLNLGSAITATLNPITDAVYGTVLDTYVSVNATTNNWIVIQNSNITLPSGKFTIGNTYTLSFLMKNDLTMYVGFMDTNGANLVAPHSPNIPITTSWTKVVYSFTATATGNLPEFYLAAVDTTHTGHIQIAQIQLEDGPKASGYHMAPEDIVDGISTAQSSINSVTGGTFTTDMGPAIINTVTSADTYVSALNAKADASDLANYATGDQLTQAQQSAQGYTDQQIAGIDFSPYVTTATMSQTNQAITAQFTSSGGVNLVKNSVGHAVDSVSKLPTFWNVVSGTPGITTDPTIAHYGATSGFTLNNSTINQTVTVTPGQTYTLSAIVLKGTAGTGYIKFSDTSSPPIAQTFNLVAGTAYTYQKVSIDVTPATSSLIVEMNGDSASGGVMFTCVMLNIGTTAFTWQQAVGEVYNSNVNFDLNGIRVMSTDSTGKATAETIMTPTQFAGYSDLNGDGIIDTSKGSVDEVFRMDTDTFVMKNATIGPVKIVQTTGTHTGIAFVANS